MGEVADGGEVGHARWVGGELGEIEFWEVGEEISEEDGAWFVDAAEFVVAGEVGVVDYGGAGVGDDLDGGFEGVVDGEEVVAGDEDVTGDADTFSFESVFLARFDVVRNPPEGDGGGVIVVGIHSGDGTEQVGSVFHGSGHGSYRVLMLGNRYYQCSRSETDSGLDAGKIVCVTRAENTATGLGAQSRQRKAETTGHTTSRARPRRILPLIVGSYCLAPQCRPSVTGIRTSEIRPLAKIRLAKNDCTSFSQSLCHEAVSGNGCPKKCV